MRQTTKFTTFTILHFIYTLNNTQQFKIQRYTIDSL